MRIKITLDTKGGFLSLPIHYNHLLQGVIYRNIDNMLSSWLHGKGYYFGKRNFKLFTFSRVFAKEKKIEREKKLIVFKSPIQFKIGSLHNDILESLAVHLIKRGEIRINRQECRFVAIEVEMPVETDGEVLVKAISPITLYSTLKTPDGKKKTYYYNPWEKEFSKLIRENLERKAIALYGKAPDADWTGFKFEPFKVSKYNEVIANFKGIWIKGWTGIYKVQIPAPYFEIAYNAGVGSKNPQGFGMLDMWRK